MTPKRDTHNNKKRKHSFPYEEESSNFLISNFTKKEVKQRTGFNDICLLLLLVAIIFGGDMKLITSTINTLTSLEDWITFFKNIYGHSLIRWIYYDKKYNLKEDSSMHVFFVLSYLLEW